MPTPENNAPVEGASVVEPTAETVETPAAPEWDGDFSTLDKQEWFTAIPEKARTHITSKAAEAAEAKEQATKATERASFLDKLFASDDAVVALQAELEKERGERVSLQAALEAATKEKGDLEQRYKTVSEQVREAEADRAFETMQAKYPDIFADVHYKDEAKTDLEDKGAFMAFMDLLSRGVPEEKAAKLARAELASTTAPAQAAAPAPKAPERPATRPTTIPKAVAASTPGGNNATTTARIIPKDMPIEEAMQIARQKALEEDGLA